KTVNQIAKSLKSRTKRINQRFFEPSRSAVATKSSATSSLCSEGMDLFLLLIVVDILQTASIGPG
ncbi:hypothetical protein, partial [Acetobacter thailandicus]|uniref:hypothetical protein n=1 Tax=Acetobacter thailandicus TaxID=1502842 RepID=UPI001BA60AEA